MESNNDIFLLSKDKKQTPSNEIYYTVASMHGSDCRTPQFLQVGHPFFHLIFGHHLLLFVQPEGHEDST